MSHTLRFSFDRGKSNVAIHVSQLQCLYCCKSYDRGRRLRQLGVKGKHLITIHVDCIDIKIVFTNARAHSRYMRQSADQQPRAHAWRDEEHNPRAKAKRIPRLRAGYIQCTWLRSEDPSTNAQGFIYKASTECLTAATQVGRA